MWGTTGGGRGLQLQTLMQGEEKTEASKWKLGQALGGRGKGTKALGSTEEAVKARWGCGSVGVLA